MGNNTDAEEKWDVDTLKKREDQRNQLRKIIFEAHEAGSVDRRDAARKLLAKDDLQYTFDELPYNKDYVSALYRGFKRSNGEDAEINVNKTKELIEKDFEFFNMVRDGSLVAGGVNLIDVIANYDDAQKADMLRRLETYDRVDAFGRGSRPFIEQLKGVISGVGLDIATTGGIATAYKLLTRPFTHKIEGEIIKSALSPTQKLMAGSAGYGAAFDVEQQATEMQLRPEQEFDPLRTGISATIGATTPLIGKPVGYVAGKAQRVFHFPQTAGTIAKKSDWVGGLAATRQLQDAFDAVQLRGVNMESGSAQMALKLKTTFKNIDNSFDGQYKQLKLNVNKNDIEVLVSKYQKQGVEIPQEVLDVIQSLQSTIRPMSGYGGNKGTYIESTVKPDAALRTIKNKLWQAKQDKIRADKRGVAFSYDRLRRELIALEESVAKKTGGDTYTQYKGLKKDFETFNKYKETDMGKKIIDIVEKKGIESKNSVEVLMNEMTSGDFSWNKYQGFMKNLEKFGNIEGRTGAASSIKKEMQQSFGYFLTHDKGSRLVAMLGQPDGRGMKLLKNVYPDDVKLWNNLESLAQKMAKAKGKAKPMASSVIANMVTARLGSKLGKDIGGELGAGAGAISGIWGINSLMNSKFFQNAMVHALNNDGRFSTSTRRWLQKKGLTAGEINSITDTMTGLPFAGFTMGNVEEIWDNNKDSIDARIEEIRQEYLF